MARANTNAQPEFELVSSFPGYHARTDITNLPPGLLIPGSQNVMTRTNGRVGIIKGYTLDGQSGAGTSAGIESAFDYDTVFDQEIHLRSYTDPATSKGVCQFRYVNPVTNLVTWQPFYSSFNRGMIRYTTFFDANTELATFCLMVDGSGVVWEWSGGIASFLSYR